MKCTKAKKNQVDVLHKIKFLPFFRYHIEKGLLCGFLLFNLFVSLPASFFQNMAELLKYPIVLYSDEALFYEV